MPWSASSVVSRIRSWLRDYDRIQSFAVLLIYIQIGCALVGSLGALYNGVLLINLVVALFALVAIENNSQSLGRTYAALLACGILLDIMWFILFSHEIWNMSSEKYGPLFLFSLRLTLWMQIIGFSVRSFSSLLWIQMYRLGVSSVDSAAYREADFDVRNSFLNPPIHEIARQNSDSDDVLGGSIYDPAYYSSLFEDAQDKKVVNEGDRRIICHSSGSASAAEPSQLRSCISRSFQAINVSNMQNRSQNA
uniref:Thiamine pyrophosphokinase n=1 Tax=Anthurium amnicola TaxID=1678845 RepID=A0A1D1YTJ7_9ARAE